MNQQTFDSLTEMLREAEDTYHKGNATLREWGAEARELVETRPGLLLGAVAISGFMAGALIRGGFGAKGRLREIFPADPLVTFIAGAAAGLLLGHRILDQVLSGLHETAGDDRPGLTTGKRMDEKPFEKSFPGDNVSNTGSGPD